MNVVKQRRLRMGFVGLLVVLGAGVYAVGYQQGFDDRVPLVLDEAGLKDTISKLETRLAVDSETLNRFRVELADSEKQVDELEKELVFYRDIMSSSEDVSAVKLRPPDLSWDPEQRSLEYRGVVQRLAPGTQFYRGRLTVKIVDSEGQSIASASSESSHDLSFKYFQRISGTIELKETVIPASVRFDIELSAPRKRTYEQTFDWSSSIVYSSQ
ncbi:MAG: hypothetical protein GWP37_00050 [Gammaproteobacteria bacterium]|nr:hypothetical protein [Gammaproteobacteria bacterium]